MNINQLDRIIEHFIKTYRQSPREIRANENTGLDLLKNITVGKNKSAGPRKFTINIDPILRRQIIFYGNIFFEKNKSLLNNEVEVLGDMIAARYIADEFDDGPIVKV